MSKPNTLSVSKRKLILAIISIALICSIASSSVVYVMAQGGGSTPITITSGPYPGAPSYTIYTDGTTYYAKDSHGAIAFSSTNATSLTLTTMNTISSNGGGVLTIKGTQTIPTRITNIQTISNNVTVIGEGSIYWTTTNNGVDPLLNGLGSSIQNVYVKSDSVFGHCLIYTEQYAVWDRFYTAFPADGGTYTSTPTLIMDGDILQEGAGKISNTLQIWFKSFEGTDQGLQILPISNTTLAIKNWADTLYKNLRAATIFGDYITAGTDNLIIATQDLDNRVVYFYSYNQGSSRLVAKLMNGNFVFEPRAVTDIPNPMEGSIYYDSGVHKLKVYNGTGWETITSVP